MGWCPAGRALAFHGQGGNEVGSPEGSPDLLLPASSTQQGPPNTNTNNNEMNN